MGFNAELNAFSRCIPPLVKDYQSDIIVFLSDVLIKHTPVDTGRARGNYLVGRKLTNQFSVNKFDPSGATVKAEAITAAKSIKPFTTSYIYNNTPYILFLDGTHPNGGGPISKQAPAGMTRVAMASLLVSFK